MNIILRGLNFASWGAGPGNIVRQVLHDISQLRYEVPQKRDVGTPRHAAATFLDPPFMSGANKLPDNDCMRPCIMLAKNLLFLSFLSVSMSVSQTEHAKT